MDVISLAASVAQAAAASAQGGEDTEPTEDDGQPSAGPEADDSDEDEEAAALDVQEDCSELEEEGAVETRSLCPEHVLAVSSVVDGVNPLTTSYYLSGSRSSASSPRVQSFSISRGIAPTLDEVLAGEVNRRLTEPATRAPRQRCKTRMGWT